MTGRPPKPTEQKRRLGNPGKRTLPAQSALAAVPAIQPEPAELSPTEVLAGVLEAGSVWLAQSDLLAVTLLRETVEEREKLRELVLSTNSSDARKGLREIDKQIIVQLSSLGFDPTARSRLGVAEIRAQSTLQRMQADRAARQ